MRAQALTQMHARKRKQNHTHVDNDMPTLTRQHTHTYKSAHTYMHKYVCSWLGRTHMKNDENSAQLMCSDSSEALGC